MNAIGILKDYFTDDVKRAVDALRSNTVPTTPSGKILPPTSFSIHSLGALKQIFAPGYEPLAEVPRPADTASEFRREAQVVFPKACAESEPQWVQEIIEGVLRDILMMERTTITETELIVHLPVPAAGTDTARLQEFLRDTRSRIRSSLKVHILELVGKSRTIVRVDLEDFVIHEDEDLPAMVGALCQGLRFNHVMKDLSLALKDIGDTGFQHLAELLLVNGSLEHVNLRGTKMLPVHLGQIASALERNITLSLSLSSLILGDNPGLLAYGDGAHVMRRVLEVSKNLKELDLRDTGVDPEAAEDIAVALSSSTSLRSLVLAQNEMGRGDFKALGDMMAVNAALEELNLEECGMLSEDLGHMISALVNNHNRCLKIWKLGQNPDLLDHDNGVCLLHLLDIVTCLEELDLNNTGLNKTGQNVAMISLGLRSNTSLHKLNLGGNRVFGKGGGKLLGDMLRFNSGLQELGLSHTTGTWTWKEDDSMYAFCDGLEHNTNLKRLDFSHNVPSLKLFKSLEKNKSITSLNLELCDFDRSVSLQAIVNMLDLNLTLTEIRLENGGGLEDTDLARVQLKLEANAVCTSSKKLMLSMNTAKPKFGRVVLCGYPYAGKTSLRLSMSESRRLDKLSHMKAMMIQVRHLSEYIWKRRWMKMLWADKTAVLARTSGVDIHILEEDSKMTLSVWDLAGQEENPSFHEHLLLSFRCVGPTSAFVIVCNLYRKQDGLDMGVESCKSAEEVQEECEYWLKLLASNTKQRPVSEVRPRVIIVLNKKTSKRRRSTRALTELISTAVVSLRKQFESYLDIVLRKKDDVEVFDVWSVKAATPFTKSLVRTTRKALNRALQPEVPSASDELSIAITKWMVRHPSRPIITWDKFERLCQVNNVEELSSRSSKHKALVEVLQKRCRAVARYMNDAGQIIYFDDLEIVVINPRWFCHCFLGKLVPASSDPSDTPAAIRGVSTSKSLESIFSQSLDEFSHRKQDKLRAILPEYKLIQLMLRLELCYESGSDGAFKQYSLPATLPLNDDAEAGSRKLQWPMRADSDQPLGHLGRRLVCKDQICTLLTPGFFPRLQVHLYNCFAQLSGFDRKQYKVERNLISVGFGGLDYVIEYSPFDYFVDILVRYPVEASDTMLQVRENVIRPIQEFCASRAGCQGVDLVEAVIRTSSVERLDLCQDRRKQSALVSELIQELEVYGPEHRHQWGKDVKVEDREDSEYILLLLGKEDLKREAERWFKGLQDAAEDLNEHFIKQDSRQLEPNLDGFSADFKETVSRMPESEGRIFSSIAKKVGQMKHWQGMLLASLSLRLGSLNNFTAQLHKQEFPKLAYLTIPDVNKVRQIVTEINPDLTMVQVHYMCEAQHRGSPHIVPKQPGRQLTVIAETLEPWWPYLAGALKVQDVMVKTGARKILSSAMIPTFSTRAYWKDRAFWLGVGKPGKTPPEWLVDFLTGPGPFRLYDDFMLHKVRYEESQQVAWICDHHLRRGKNAGILTLLES